MKLFCISELPNKNLLFKLSQHGPIFGIDYPTANALMDVPGDVFNIFAERGGRTALVTKGMNTWKVPQYCSKDVIVCQTKLVSLYLDSKVLSFPNEFKELIHKKGDYDILIGTDSNSHSTVWNCPATDRRGELLEEKNLIDKNLSCLNVGNNPTFKNGSGDSTIMDLTLANYRLAQRVSNWQVEQLLHSTDHYCVLFTVNNCPISGSHQPRPGTTVRVNGLILNLNMNSD